MAPVHLVTVNMSAARPTTPEPAKKMAIPKPVLVRFYLTPIKLARMTDHIMTNAFVTADCSLAYHLCNGWGKAATDSIKAVATPALNTLIPLFLTAMFLPENATVATAKNIR